MHMHKLSEEVELLDVQMCTTTTFLFNMSDYLCTALMMLLLTPIS